MSTVDRFADHAAPQLQAHPPEPGHDFNAVLLPVVIMLMFVYMLGNAFNVGVKYIDYATPG